jgi:competence protein ComEC
MSADTIDLDGGLATSPQRRLHAAAGLLERERFFLWSPVCLGLGIAAYFAMPIEPQLGMAFVPLVLALILRAVTSSGTISSVVLTALILAGLGFADAKLRVEAVRGPLLKSLHNAEVAGVVALVESKFTKGQRLTIASPQISGLAADKTPAFVRVRTMAHPPPSRVTAFVSRHRCHRQRSRHCPAASTTQELGGSIRSAPSATPSRRR